MSAPAPAATDTRTRILEATAQCIADEGVAALRMASIARTAGVSTALLHYHFATKERLFEQVLTYSYEAATVLDLEGMRDSGQPAPARLADYLDRCLPSDDELTRGFTLWQELGIMSMRQPDLAAVNADLNQGDVDRVASIIGDGVDDGSFRDVDVDLVARAAVALCDGLGARVLRHDPRTTLQDARTIVASTIGPLLGLDVPLPLPGVAAAGTSSPSSLPAPRSPREAHR